MKIAFVAGWTSYQEWQNATEKANQMSAPVTLKASQSYFIQTLHKEGGGGDNITVGWTGPVIGTTITVLDGKYCTAFIRTPEPLFKASTPSPANGATEVVSPMFTWTPGKTAATHHVYVGTDPNLTAKGDDQGAGMVANGQGMFYLIAGLTPGAKYYWRVDEIDASGTVTTGDVWSFTVQPMEAHNPSPYDGALWMKTTQTFKWAAGQGAAKQRMYISTDKTAVTSRAASAVQPDQTAVTLTLSTLKANSTYYWCVDELDSAGKVSAAGPVWTFTTIDAAGGAIVEYFNGMTLSGKPIKVTTVPEINWSLASGQIDPAVPATGFSARYTANLNVPVSGAYTFYNASDDGSRLFLNGVQLTNGWVDEGETEYASPVQNLVAGQSYLIVMEYYQNGGGDAARLRWSGPGIAKDIIPQGALQIPQVAISASPSNNAVEVPDTSVLGWTGGPKALAYTVYFGTDKTKVSSNDKSVALAPMITTTYTPATPLAWNTTYYWKVDETLSDGSTVPGQLWTFTTANWIVVQAAQVALSYDDSKDPYMSALSFDVTGDLTRGGASDLALRFQGLPAVLGGVVYNDANQSYKVTGAGTDIWNNSDQFEYAYKTLTGDGSMVARITGYKTNTGDSTWAKGGVMIRQSTYAGSAWILMAITNGSANGATFQWRQTTDGSCGNSDSAAPAKVPPYWVKITRTGNSVSAFYSADGKTWTQQGTAQTITMTDPVLIGLAAGSHVNSTTPNTFTFDNVSTTGTITPAGPFTVADNVGTHALANATAPLYVSITDKAGKIALVNNPNPNAVNTTVMDLWRVPLSSFTGVDLKNAKTLSLGVGNGKAGGFGVMQFADVRILLPVTLPAAGAVDVTKPGDPLNGFPNYSGSSPAAEMPANVIDNNVATKYLNFANSGSTNGKTVMPTGFYVTPSMGFTVVTGLTFTSANDTPARDPIAWELYGSFTSINGPWYLIAKGTIDDFGRPIDWPRNWKGVTPIGFANTTAFSSYQVSFTALHIPSGANSMQIAEVEILGVAGKQPIITDVVRANGQGGTRTDGSPINGTYTGNTAPVLPPAGGLKDGNFVYSDRPYPWAQTPASMVGSEYVLMYNQDKTTGEKDVTYTVTFTKAATIWVSCDDRAWTDGTTVMTDQMAVDRIVAAFAKPGQFKDTGVKIFVQENSTTNRPMSVFSAAMPAGTYVFGSNDNSGDYYTIGAQ